MVKRKAMGVNGENQPWRDRNSGENQAEMSGKPLLGGEKRVIFPPPTIALPLTGNK